MCIGCDLFGLPEVLGAFEEAECSWKALCRDDEGHTGEDRHRNKRKPKADEARVKEGVCCRTFKEVKLAHAEEHGEARKDEVGRTEAVTIENVTKDRRDRRREGERQRRNVPGHPSSRAQSHPTDMNIYRHKNQPRPV